jgi:hypothetical protein
MDAEAAPDRDRQWRSTSRRSQLKGNGGEADCPMVVSVLRGVGEHHGGRAKLARLVVKPDGGWWWLLLIGLSRQTKAAVPTGCKSIFGDLSSVASRPTVGGASALCPGSSVATVRTLHGGYR